MNLSSPVRFDEIFPFYRVIYNPVCCGYKPNRLKLMRAVQVRAVNHGGRNSEISTDGNNKGTTAKAVARPAGSHVAVDASRLEPRVEEKDGYWVLKEEFRTGINLQEKVKLEKEPIKLFMENEIEKLARKPFAEIENDEVDKDSIDVRVKWMGLFHRRKHQYGRFMMRIRLPNGVTTSLQIRYLASVIQKYGREGSADITTRQNWQIRGIVLDEVPAILKGLKEVGLSSLQSGMDNARNPIGNPLAGIDPHEIIDSRPYTKVLTDYIHNNGNGNPSISNLPRKFNICVVGSHDLFEHPHINDLAYVPAMKNERFGFNLLVGGLLTSKRWEKAVPLDAWVAGDDVVPVCRAILEAFRDLGNRGNRQKTRVMYLIDEMGIERFRSEVVKRMPGEKLERAATEDMLDKSWERRSYLGVHPQKQEGLNFVGLHVPVGRFQAEDMIELARLAEQYGTQELRLTIEQNAIIPNVPTNKIEALLQEPLLQKISPSPPLLLSTLVSCPGNQFCGLSIIETKARALKITEELDRTMEVPKHVRMHWIGCPHTCGQVQIADIGFLGCMTKDENMEAVEGVDIFMGGSVGADSHLGDLIHKGVPCKDLVPVVQELLIKHFGAMRKADISK